jgi:type II secretory pathway component PulJ
MKRRGFSLYEVLAACVLLAVLGTICLQFLGSAATARRAARQRLSAIQEATNLMERTAARSWDKLTPQAAGDAKLSVEAAQSLPGGAAEVRIDDPAGTPPAKRITVVVRWENSDGTLAEPVRLVSWRGREGLGIGD